MAVVVLELDEGYQVAVARALVEAPDGALVAAADPESRAGQIAIAETYQEAIEYAQELVERGWRAVVWEVPRDRRRR